MSIIVYSKKHKMIAADTLVTVEDSVWSKKGNKLAIRVWGDTGQYNIVGSTGNYIEGYQFKQWATGKIGAKPDMGPDAHLNYIKINYDSFNDVVTAFWGDKQMIDMPSEEDILVIGSGSEVATGAVKAGANPIEAVRIVSDTIITCGGGIEYIDFKNITKGIQSA